MAVVTNNYLGRMLIQEGMLIRFSPQTIFGKNTTNHHFGVVINANHSDNTIGIIVGATSNVLGLTEYAIKRNLDSSTVVVINGGAHPHFGRQTAFNCNAPKSIHMNQLAIWYKNKLIDVPSRQPYIDSVLLVDIKAGVNNSDLVSDKVKKLLL